MLAQALMALARDNPLKKAIIDRAVNNTLKDILKSISEQRSDIANTRYQAYLAAGL
ncbi:MAG: hypothetical protein ACREUY_06115 [Burkholderiales bacterium]